MSKKAQRRLISILLSLIIAAGIWIGQRMGWIDNIATTTQPGFYKILSIEDGDTVTVDMNGTTERVRFIGVDTPETQDPRTAVQCFGKVAAAFTRELIGQNDVRLEADPTNTNRDRYNRLLRYVYLPDGRLVNAEIIRQGYGFSYELFPFQKQAEFHELEVQARENNLGLWGACEIHENGDKETTNPA